MNNAELMELDTKSFDPHLKKVDRPLVVMFYTDRCPNCAAIAPVYRTLADELDAHAVFARLNAQRSPVIASRYGVMGVPTFKIFCDGRPISELVGGVNETLLRNTIKDVVRHRTECISRSTPVNYEMDGYL